MMFPFEKTKEKEEKPKRAAGLVSYKFNEFCQKNIQCFLLLLSIYK